MDEMSNAIKFAADLAVENERRKILAYAKEHPDAEEIIRFIESLIEGR